jgi:hypothetical protein
MKGAVRIGRAYSFCHDCHLSVANSYSGWNRCVKQTDSSLNEFATDTMRRSDDG